MNATDVIDVQLPRRSEHRSNWEREHAAFAEMLPALLAVHRGRYVAIYQGAVVAISDGPVAAAMEAYAKHGYAPIHVGLVTDQPPPRLRIPSPRLQKNMGHS